MYNLKTNKVVYNIPESLALRHTNTRILRLTVCESVINQQLLTLYLLVFSMNNIKKLHSILDMKRH